MAGSPATIDYADVQGTILRGYRVDLARHFVLSFTDPTRVRQLLGLMVSGDSGVPQVTTAARWGVKPAYFLNVGFTCAGLAALGLTAEQLASFDAAFQRGATADATAQIVGDINDSAPADWIGGLSDGAAVHAVFSLWVTDDPGVMEAVTRLLRQAFSGCARELSSHDANALPNNGVHFGYRDNIAQPTVAGAPPKKHPVPDHQPVVSTGEFLLGYPNEIGGTPTVSPAELSRNSSYSAFRILEQDVAGFEAFLATASAQHGIGAEELAAKVCGRWRNGNPLVLSPDAPGTPLPPSSINNFAYAAATDRANDVLGLKCPIGSHIRRTNPRDEAVVGGSVESHRITRRAMPYGPPFDPARPDPTPRGLIGHFINASLLFQFEFLMSQWAGASDFVMSATVPGHPDEGNAVFNISGQDVFLGVNTPTSNPETVPQFTIARSGRNGKNNVTLTGFSRLVHTRGGAYCFLPSISGLRYLAAL